METLITLIAIAGVLGLAGSIVWRVDRYANARLELLRANAQLTEREQAVRLLEQETQAYVNAQVRDELVDLRTAEIARQTAEEVRQTHVVEALKEDAVLAERRRLTAHAAAQEALAQEFLRAEHAAKLEQATGKPSLEDALEIFQSLIDCLGREGMLKPSFDDFLDSIERYRH